jgi:hypothetical protein
MTRLWGIVGCHPDSPPPCGFGTFPARRRYISIKTLHLDQDEKIEFKMKKRSARTPSAPLDAISSRKMSV